MRSPLWFFVFVAVWCSNVDSYRILMVFPHISPSHYNIGKGLMKGLVADGHNVTMMSPFKQSKIGNFTEIHLDGIIEEYAKRKFYGQL